MRSFVYTTGTSSQQALRVREPDLHASVQLQPGQPSEPATGADGQLRPPVLELVASVHAIATDLKDAAEAAVRAGDDERLRTLGVEAESLVRLQRGDNAAVEGPCEADRLLFLASDTPAGVVAACTAAAQVGRWPQVTVVTAEGASPQPAIEPAGGRPVAEVLVLDGLATARPGAVEHAAGALARGLLLAATGSEHGQVSSLIADLSGGYKVTIPLAVHLLEYLGALHHRHRRFPADVQLWFRHEYAASLFHQVSLRRLDPDTIGVHIDELDAVADGLHPSTDTLAGFAYGREGDRLQLTAVGRGLHVLLRGAR